MLKKNNLEIIEASLNNIRQTSTSLLEIIATKLGFEDSDLVGELSCMVGLICFSRDEAFLALGNEINKRKSDLADSNK